MTDDLTKKATKVLTGAAAIAASVQVHVDEQHGEVDRVQVLGIPVFKRNDAGTPRVFGIPFPRWIRGARRG
jgi:hypothetical protein